MLLLYGFGIFQERYELNLTHCYSYKLHFVCVSANVAAAAGGVLYGLSYMPYLFISRRYSQMSWTLKAVSCLLSNVAMANGAMVISMYEGAGNDQLFWCRTL